MTTDQDPKLEIIPSQHPVDAIVRAIVAGAEFARRVFDQTKDYEMPPDKEDRENFESAFKAIETCISETKRLHDEGLLEGWENRTGIVMMQASKPIQMNGGQTFTITQEFKDVDPDKIIAAFQQDLAKLAEHRVEAKTVIPFERRNAAYPGPEPDAEHSITEGRTPDFEFPGPWISLGDTVSQIKCQIANEGDVIYLDEPMVSIRESDIEVVPSESGTGCKVRALTLKGHEWILKTP